ncbi:hypothetical protein TIFTF001_000419 [Ficus carica]|uniref:Uncharacterized protein n=1 Tax=Ficus carica TaxID=3494 RepID=A0AA88CJX1_FICCA|nr:hypothetical protein TIFTF001_000419 [Ficus carica]
MLFFPPQVFSIVGDPPPALHYLPAGGRRRPPFSLFSSLSLPLYLFPFLSLLLSPAALPRRPPHHRWGWDGGAPGCLGWGGREPGREREKGGKERERGGQGVVGGGGCRGVGWGLAGEGHGREEKIEKGDEKEGVAGGRPAGAGTGGGGAGSGSPPERGEERERGREREEKREKGGSPAPAGRGWGRWWWAGGESLASGVDLLYQSPATEKTLGGNDNVR